MDEMLPADDRAAALALAGLIREHRGGDTVVMDLRGLNAWTDFFVVSTVTSAVQMEGLQRYIREFAHEKGIAVLRQHRKTSPDDEWKIIDLGTIVVHLMTAKSRAFYELERLWSASVIIAP
ncbi:MAG: ribosome silencing factor [Spirochaetaceae bacterium]|jgi:ribosome-associated protein|nr:ribosome silencing factor [Spirochaetaceae bacterium]